MLTQKGKQITMVSYVTGGLVVLSAVIFITLVRNKSAKCDCLESYEFIKLD